ncbi:MAG: SPOR domain-containing protein [Bacteroidia bacterium]
MELSVEVYLTSAFRELDAFALPKIGTFRKIRKGAHISDDASLVFPPEVEIEFHPIPDPRLDLTYYLRDHIHIEIHEAERIVQSIYETILRSLKEFGYFEVSKIGMLKEDQEHILKFFTYHSKDNVLADDFFGLTPVRFSQNNQLVLHQGENPTYMKNDYSAEKTMNFSTVGWKTFLLIALIFTLGFLVINQGPFIKHRSSIGNGALAIRPLEPPRSSFHRNLLSENGDDSLALTFPDGTLADAETEVLDGGSPASTQTESQPAIDQPLASQQEKELPAIDDSRLFSDNTNARLSQEALGSPRGQDLGNTRGTSTSDGYGNVSNLSVLDTAKKQQTREQPEPSAARLLPEVKNYHLIAGSFGTLSAAQKFVNQMKGEGADAIILFPVKGTTQTYRVSIYRNSIRAKVEEYGAKQERLGLKSGWIFEER